MEKVLAFITPCPIGEGCKFSTRVFTSWISLGLALGLALGLYSSLSTSKSANSFLNLLIAVPIVVCFFGLLGLGIASFAGVGGEYPWWLWYLFPILTYIILGI